MTSARRDHTASGQLPIVVSNPDKVFWPEEGYTKLDLVEYYNAIFPKLSPYVKDRILTLERCPDGMRGECFFQNLIVMGVRRLDPVIAAHFDKPDTAYKVIRTAPCPVLTVR